MTERLSPLEVERIERRLQAWEDRPPATYGDAALRYRQQDDDIKALLAEVRALNLELSRAREYCRTMHEPQPKPRRLFGR